MNTILVLGFTLNSDGTLSETLRNRLDSAIAEFQSDTTQQIIVSGGKSSDASAEFPTQAEVMSAYLQEKGISDSKIAPDPDSHNTVQQLLMLRKRFTDDAVTQRHEITIIASDCGFSKRVELLSQKIFGSQFTVRVIASKVPDELRDQFTTSESEALFALKKFAPKIQDGDWQTVETYARMFQEGKIEVKDYPAQK